MESSVVVEEVRNAVVLLVVTIAACSLLTSVLRLVKLYLYDPIRISRIMAKQGVRGPPFIPVVGSAHEIGACEKSFPESLPLDDHYGLLPTVKTQFHLFFPQFGKCLSRCCEGSKKFLALALITRIG